jgi:hypothetical protein
VTDAGISAKESSRELDSQVDTDRERDELRRSQEQAEQASKMMGSGATVSQVAAYTGIRLVKLEADDKPTPKVTPSHQFVDRDEDGG